MTEEFKTNYTSIDYFIENSFLGKPGFANHTGFLRPSRFGVTYELPVIVFENYNTTITNVHSFLTDNTLSMEVPGFELTDAQTPLRHSIENRNTGNISVTFYEDVNLSVRTAMWHWMDFIVRHRADDDNFERHYLDDIQGSITCIPLLPNGKMASRKEVFKYVFPTVINPVNYDTSEENIIGKTTVTFRYRYHYVDQPSQSSEVLAASIK